ncbi:MAG: peptide-methionine (S)-S-oxide reductase MsrA [Prevotella sp.]|uniref:peptide-methionine (S)-S-oxide reductase MsrA n=1 Tax=Prevotella sp. TaxID=59823 RepID=UPI002A821EAD|nr:peptide-methionine (S)-S-oxide reductase MsrA [Prevotella sp.]MDY4019356.1 peptide-methionine (S)-S-oxide reductase MsrA [Prevotella sp.]
MKEIYFAGGCFWGTEHYLKQMRGVKETQVGYANGNTKAPTYREVCSGSTGFAETVRVVYDPEVITLEFLTDMYFKSIDPTSFDRQGNDIGPQYRTGIYFIDAEDKPVLQKVYDRVQREVGDWLAVELKPLDNFYEAEEYHQDYLDKNPNGYCHLPRSMFRMAREANR